MRTIGIYKITSPSGNVYIGQSWCIEERFSGYRRKECRKQRALFFSFTKYSVESHLLEVVERIDTVTASQSLLDEREQFYIDLYRNAGVPLLNCREGGSNGRLLPETRKQISQSLTGHTPWNKGLKGAQTHSTETRERMRAAKQGKRPNNFGKARSIAATLATTTANTGQKRTLEQRRRISAGMVGNTNRKGKSAGV